MYFCISVCVCVCVCVCERSVFRVAIAICTVVLPTTHAIEFQKMDRNETVPCLLDYVSTSHGNSTCSHYHSYANKISNGHLIIAIVECHQSTINFDKQ